MLFNSEAYLFFLPAVVVLTWCLPPPARPAFLLLASWYFYAFWSPPFLFLIIGLTLFNYLLGLVQGRQPDRRRSLLVLALLVNIGALGIFKYLGLLDQSAARLAHIFGLPYALPLVRFILPLGLSFFTFEFIHYQVELYRGRPPIVNPINFGLFPAFFPTQIAGPIKRYEDFNGQVEARPRFDPELFLSGVELIALGLFKKVVVADALLGPIADPVYALAGQATGFDAWTAMFAFYIQIYFDFSGYTDIGRGSAQLLGYRVPVNFNAPHLATSFMEFWRRWHISLSFWLRDYIYIPLGGSKKGKPRQFANLMVTLALGGLWHGAAWHFMLMGVYGGLVLALERVWLARPWLRIALPAWLGAVCGWLFTQATISIGVHLLRAPSLLSAAHLWKQMVSGSPRPSLVSSLAPLEILAVLAATMVAQAVATRWNPRRLVNPSLAGIVLRPAYAGALLLVALYVAVVTTGVVAADGRADPANPGHRYFYFQF